MQRAVDAGLDAVIVRARAVFGPGDNSLLPRLVEAARIGKLRQIGDGHNATYAREELRHLPSPVLRAPLSVVLKVLAAVLRWSEIDRTVYVDNWLVSTNLHPELTKAQLAEIPEYLVDRYPDHAVAVRSADTRGNRQLLEDAVALGYRKVASRRVYYQDARSRVPFRSTSYRRDAGVFEKSSYEVLRVTSSQDVDLDRLVELYRLLYIEKYSHHNPQFNSQFVRMAIDRRLLHFFVLRKQDRVDAVAGFFIRGEVMTTPFFGYDTRLPRETGLYRMLSLQLLREARERHLVLHASSGAAGFKRARGTWAQPNTPWFMHVICRFAAVSAGGLLPSWQIVLGCR